MPFLKEQVQIINAELRASCLADKRFQSGRYEALVVDVTRKEEGVSNKTYPCVMSASYEAQPISVDDTYPIIIYHKVLSKNAINVQQVKNYGDGESVRGELLEMKMVVYGKYSALNMTAEQLEALITMNFPSAISYQKISGMKLDLMFAKWISSNLNSAQVFGEEYKGFELFLSPEDILFSVRYSIESRYRKGCFTICDCDSSVSP